MKLIIAALMLTSFSSFAAVELRGSFNAQSCIIKDGKVTRTQRFGKEKKLALVQTTNISTEGLEDFARTARTASQNAPTSTNTDDEAVYEAILDGEKFSLQMDNSKEALNLIQLIVRACNFR